MDDEHDAHDKNAQPNQARLEVNLRSENRFLGGISPIAKDWRSAVEFWSASSWVRLRVESGGLA